MPKTEHLGLAGAGRLGLVSSGLLNSQRIRRILALLGWRTRAAHLAPKLDAVAGWGEKPTARLARQIAQRRNLAFITLEDGFLRSAGLGVAGDPPLSIVIDGDGAYFNWAAQSRLESLLLDASWESSALLDRAAAGVERLRKHRLSKYNHAPPLRPGATPDDFVLVIDQTVGDAAIAGAGADAASFQAMLHAALAEAGGSPVLIKTHPDVLAGKRAGYLTDCAAPGARLFAEDVNPWDLFDRAKRVYTVSSLMGYEARLAGCETHCFGWPFYAGWGATIDRGPQLAGLRRRRRSLSALFAASHLLYPIYYDPEADQLCDFERVVELLA